MTQNHSIFSDENIPTPVIRANDLDVVHRRNQDLHYHESIKNARRSRAENRRDESPSEQIWIRLREAIENS